MDHYKSVVMDYLLADKAVFVNTEGGTFRRRTTEATSSLSVAQNSGDLPGFGASVVAIGFCDARVRGRVSMHSLGAPCAAACSTESLGQSYAPSDNPKKP